MERLHDYEKSVDEMIDDTVLKDSKLIQDDPDAITEWLTYSSYAWNRTQAPHVEPHEWGFVFPKWELYEHILQNHYKKG